MGAGDLIIIGWDGTPLYKEVTAPAVAYEPSKAANKDYTVKKTLNRILNCRKVDVQEVIAGLTFDNVSIDYDSPNNGGGYTNIDYGAGWTLKTFGEAASSLGNYFAELNLRYEKSEVTKFYAGLPTGITMGGSGGIGFIKYLGNVLYEFDSQFQENGSGWNVVEVKSFDVEKFKQGYSFKRTDAYYVYNEYGHSKAELYKSGYHTASFWGIRNPQSINGCKLQYNGYTAIVLMPELSDYQDLGYERTASYATGTEQSIQRNNNGDVIQEAINTVTKIHFKYLELPPTTLQWYVDGSIIKLTFQGITLFEWDVTGLVQI